MNEVIIYKIKNPTSLILALIFIVGVVIMTILRPFFNFSEELWYDIVVVVVLIIISGLLANYLFSTIGLW